MSIKHENFSHNISPTRIWFSGFARLPCHRRPDRSFHYQGRQFPVCARCTGLYIGMMVFPFLLFLQVKIDQVLAGLFLIPMIVDGWTQYQGWRESNNVLRLVTGLIAGISVALLLASKVIADPWLTAIAHFVGVHPFLAGVGIALVALLGFVARQWNTRRKPTRSTNIN